MRATRAARPKEMLRIALTLALALPRAAADDTTAACVARAADEPAALLCVAPDAALSVDGARAALETSLTRGWFNLSSVVIDGAAAAGADVSTVLHQVSGRIRARLSELAEQLSHSAQSADIPPAIEWAQSANTVAVQVKWALKLSNPATLGCVPAEPDFGYGSARPVPAASRSIIFKAVCAVKRKTFALHLHLHGNVSIAESSWAESSVGRATLTLRKAVPGAWPRLVDHAAVRVPVWWSMQETMDAADEAEVKRRASEAEAARVAAADAARAATAAAAAAAAANETAAGAAAAAANETAAGANESAAAAGDAGAVADAPAPAAADDAEPAAVDAATGATEGAAS